LQTLEQSLQTAQDPTQLQGEIADLRKQLNAARTSLNESRGTLDTLSQKVAEQQGLIDKTDKDHRTEVDRWQYATWVIGSAGVGAASMAVANKGDPASTGLGAVGGAAAGAILKWIFSGF